MLKQLIISSIILVPSIAFAEYITLVDVDGGRISFKSGGVYSCHMEVHDILTGLNNGPKGPWSGFCSQGKPMFHSNRKPEKAVPSPTQ